MDMLVVIVVDVIRGVVRGHLPSCTQDVDDGLRARVHPKTGSVHWDLRGRVRPAGKRTLREGKTPSPIVIARM